MSHNKNIKISIITAVFNRKDTIEQCILSILNQDYIDLECVLQDGNSNDGTIEKIESFKDERIILESFTDNGIYDAINKGISRSSGEIIGLMHSDDYFPNKSILGKVCKAFEDPNVDGVYGDLDYVSAINDEQIVRKWKSGEYVKENLKIGWMPPHPTLYLRRYVYENFGLYDTKYKIAADYDAILRYLIKGNIKLKYIPETFVKMRTGGISNKNFKNLLIKSIEDYKIVKSYGVGGVLSILNKNLLKINQFF